MGKSVKRVSLAVMGEGDITLTRSEVNQLHAEINKTVDGIERLLGGFHGGMSAILMPSATKRRLAQIQKRFAAKQRKG